MPVLAERNIYLSDFERTEKELARVGSQSFHRLRHAALERFLALGFPTLDDEEWRFTNLAPMTGRTFQLAGPAVVKAEDIQRVSFPDADCSRLVFVNGRFASELSALQALPDGVIAGSLADALKTQVAQVEPYLARFADYEEHAFTALNTAFIRDGAFLLLPRGKAAERPVHLVFVSTAPNVAAVAHPRILIVAGENSQARVIESYVAVGPEVYFTNAVTEVVLAEGSHLDHYKVQRESRRAFHIHTLQIHQGRSSTFASQNLVFGGGLVRNEVNAVLNAEGCECTLNGLYLAGGEQLIDNHTRIDHAKPHCASHELYKGILDGKAKGVFNGKIYVHPDAQKTDAKQTNQTLLLSEDAVIDTKPQLEIFADDVKCTHGATVGQLDAEALFYLQTRGIGRDEARALLTYAFANDIVGRVQVEPLRRWLEGHLTARQPLPQKPEGPEAL